MEQKIDTPVKARPVSDPPIKRIADFDIIHPKISVKCEGITEMQDEHDLNKMHKLWKARNHFVNRKNVTYYINADDLIKTYNDNNEDIYIRLVITDNQKHKHHRSNHKAFPKTPKNDDRSCNNAGDDSVTIDNGYLSADNRGKDGNRRSNSVGSSNTCKDIYVGNFAKSCGTIETSHHCKKNISILDKTYNITYVHSDTIYYLYVLEKISTNIFCKGINDSDVKCSNIPLMSDITIFNENTNSNIVIFSENIKQMKFPIYFSLLDNKVKYNITEFLSIIPGLVETAYNQIL